MNKTMILSLFWSILAICSLACSEGGSKLCRGEYEYDWQALIPGPGELDFDAELARAAQMRDRQFHVFHALPTGLNAEISISRDKVAERAAIEDFLSEDHGWDFESFSGYSVVDVVDSWWKVAGAYAGVGIAADAFRYGVMRDQCYSDEELQKARDQLLSALAGLHLAVEVTGVEGAIVRGLANVNFKGAGQDEQTTPLFDADGMPLPAEKDNGTWRADNSGENPDFIWEDSCSRDMLIGWVVGFAAAWEVIEDDQDIPQPVKDTLRADALGLALGLKQVRESGYDLELPDADGRTTFHGYLNEQNVDRLYLGARNGFHAIMAVGIMAALADIADDSQVDAYLYDQLLTRRELALIARDDMMFINMGATSNFSNYQMAFAGAWLALRHLSDQTARLAIVDALENQLYDTPDQSFQPVEAKQSFFDLVYVAGKCGASASSACQTEPDQAAIGRGLETLTEFPAPPFWEFERINCDQSEIDSGLCTALDGTQLDVLGEVGRNGDLIAAQPVPMRIRVPSNFYWRSNPYVFNGGAEGPAMFPGVDFRLAYWAGRWVRATEEDR